MKLDKLNFVHFFVSDKEYLLEVDTIKYVKIDENTFSVVFVCDEIPAISEFFLAKADSEFVFFFGNNEKEYDCPVVSSAGFFKCTTLIDGLFCILFSTIKE